MRKFSGLVLLLLLISNIVGCGNDDNSDDTGTDGDSDTDSDSDTDTDSDTDLPSQPMCVYNQAYQENYEADSVSEILASAVNCYVLIDPFESTEAREAILEMQSAGNTVGCYISSGTCEDWRDDFEEMQQYCVEEQWGQWAGEYFVDMPTDGLIALMNARIDNMASWGCDMVEFDNMDWAFDEDLQSEYGWSATPKDAIAYNQVLCEYTQSKNMGCMAKNTREGATMFDGGTFESFTDELNWWETSHLQGFVDAGQLGIVIHYDEKNCQGVYDNYIGTYGSELSFICEDPSIEGYLHFNE